MAVFYIFGLRKAYLALNADQARMMQQVIESEREAARADTECQYMKLTLAQTLQRPAVAVVSDENLQQFAAVIESILKAPDRMN